MNIVDEDCVRKSVFKILKEVFTSSNKFKIGDRVICLENVENSDNFIFETKNKIGVVKILDFQHIGVEFEENVNGHGLIDKKSNQNSKIGYGLWIKEENLIKYENKKENKEMVEILFARKNKDVKIPTKDEENAGYDIYAYFEEESVTLKPHETKMISTGVHSCVDINNVLIGKERGSTGTIGMKCGAGVVDSSYRGEIFIVITNDNDKDLIISKFVDKTIKTDSCILYPYSKAIAQLLLLPVPKSFVREIPLDELKAIPSKRGEGALGDSGK